MSLTSLGSVYQMYIYTESPKVKLGPSPSCTTGSNGTQVVLRSLSYQGAKKGSARHEAKVHSLSASTMKALAEVKLA